MATINLNQQHGQWKKMVGSWIGRGGKRVERVWWLGTDRTTAERLASALVGQWQQIKAAGRDVWTDRDVSAVIEFTGLPVEWTYADGGSFTRTADGKHRVTVPAGPVAAVMAVAAANGYAMQPVAPATPLAVRFADAMDAYAAQVTARTLKPTKYSVRIGQSVAALKTYLGTLGLDVTLERIDRHALERITTHVKRRPNGRNTGEPIAVATVKTLLQHWKQGIDWIDGHADGPRFGGWQAPRRWEALFDLDASAIRTKAERDAAADGPDQITIAEVAAVYRACQSDLHRAVVLSGLFLAQGQTELAVTRREEFDLAAQTFQHRRNKTGQAGQYWVPRELAKLLRDLWAERPAAADDLAFRTRAGLALVSEKSDSVRLMWDDLRERVGDKLRPGMTFYCLRTLFGHAAKVAGGSDLRTAALSHAAGDVGDVHYSNHRDFKAVAKVGRTLHRELKAAGAFDL